MKMPSQLSVRLCLLASTSMALLYGSVSMAGDFDLPAPQKPTGKSLTLWATHYYVHQADVQASGVALIDARNAQVAGPIGRRDWCLGAIEGTLLVTDATGASKTLNYADARGPKQVDCRAVLNIHTKWIDATGRSRFRLAFGPYGDGVRNYRLVPYRTIAVDPKVIPFGTVLFVPAIRGKEVTMPGGARVVHDGYFFAGDTGGAIKGSHVDMFSGSYSGNQFPGIVGSSPESTFKALVIDAPEVVSVLAEMHRQKS